MTLSRIYWPGLLMCLALSAAPALAQDQPDDDVLLRGSNRALSFTLDELRLGTLDGGVGARWWISQNTVLRTTFNLSVISDEEVTEGQTDDGISAFGVGASFLVEWHTHEFRSVSPYMASGFGVNFDIFSRTTDFSSDNPIRRRRVKGTAVDFSVNAGLGVEVYLTKSVSLSGEHLFVATVRTADDEIKDSFREGETVIAKRDLRSFHFGTGTSRLIVSVYF